MAGPEHLYDHPITIWRRSGIGQGGDETYGAPETAFGHWIQEERLRTTASGEQIGSMASVMLPVDVAVGDRILNGTSAEASPDVAGALRVIGPEVSRAPGSDLVVRRAYLA